MYRGTILQPEPQLRLAPPETRISGPDPIADVILGRHIRPMILFARSLPELAADLPPKLPDAEVEFDARVKQRFPLGTSEDDLKAELLKQGFKLLPEDHGVQDATLYRGWIVKALWSVRWKSRHGLITDSWGVFGFKAP